MPKPKREALSSKSSLSTEVLDALVAPEDELLPWMKLSRLQAAMMQLCIPSYSSVIAGKEALLLFLLVFLLRRLLLRVFLLLVFVLFVGVAGLALARLPRCSIQEMQSLLAFDSWL